ncbi:MAG TPA: hypothetical protein VFV03_05165 [Solirubrobacteraceae bacterium]|nr:hypothetical protein [Solirubrobacteraceae bacterium]
MAGADEAEQTPQAPEQAPQAPDRAPEQTPQAPGFGERGRMRRRARFLRKARELAYRDLGGLVFDLHRFGRRNDRVVMAKLATLRQIDTELRALEEALRDRRPVTVLREVGIAACPRCAAIHGSDDRFCPGCGLAFDTHADRPLSTAPVNRPAQVEQAQAPARQAQAPAPALQSPAIAQARVATPASASTPASTPTPAPAPPPAPGAPLATQVERTPATAQPTGRASPAPAQPPAHEPASPVASPVAGQTPAQAPPAPADRGEPERMEEDEPTQILRPPARGA